MSQRLERERLMYAASRDPSRRDLFGVETFTDEQNNPERLLNDPIFEIENAKCEKGAETEQREHLIAPFHFRDVEARRLRCQRKNRLVRAMHDPQVARRWRSP